MSGQPVSIKDDTAVDEVITEVQKGLATVQAASPSGLPPLQKVTLTLQTEFVRLKDNAFKFLIFKWGRTWERGRSQELVLTLTPQKSPPPASIEESVPLRDLLAKAILSAVQGVESARENDPSLTLREFSAEFAFYVETKNVGSAGAAFEIVPVSAEVKDELTKKALHKIQLSFQVP